MDATETTEQVRNIEPLYQCDMEVVVWLGEESDAGRRGVELLGRIWYISNTFGLRKAGCSETCREPKGHVSNHSKGPKPGLSTGEVRVSRG